MSRTLRSLAVAALIAIPLAACGDDDSSSSGSTTGGADTAGVTELEVTAEDIAFGEDSYEASAGSVEVTYSNEGAIPHSLVIEDVDGFRLEVEANGDVDEGTVELEAGSYRIYCDIPGHEDAGMVATLEVS